MTIFKTDDFGTFTLDTEDKVHRALSITDDAFNFGGARVYGINAGGTLSLLDTDDDIYDLLKKKSVRSTVHLFDSAVIVTAGWGAPLNEDGTICGAPSEHPERRRVRLTIVVSDSMESDEEIVASVLRFADDADNTILDLGGASGSLSNAVREFYYEGANQ
jgi:hypothetical protein